jgi:hypothetical protein
MKSYFLFAASGVALLGCMTSGQVETAHLTGVVFRDTDTSIRIRLLVGKTTSYHQVDVRYQGDLSQEVKDLRLTSDMASLSCIHGGDMVEPYTIDEGASRVSFSIPLLLMNGDITVTGSSMSSDNTPVQISGPFSVPVGAIGATEWTCDQDEIVKNCRFI